MIEPALTLTSFEVDLSLFDDRDAEAAELLAHANVAATVINEYLREAKAALAIVGINVNWGER